MLEKTKELELLKKISFDKVDSKWKGVISGDMDRFEQWAEEWIKQREENQKRQDELFATIEIEKPADISRESGFPSIDFDSIWQRKGSDDIDISEIEMQVPKTWV